MTQGPNVKSLICHRAATVMVPKGGGIQDAVNSILKPNGILDAAREATKWVEEAIRVVRLASEPNPWKDATD